MKLIALALFIAPLSFAAVPEGMCDSDQFLKNENRSAKVKAKKKERVHFYDAKGVKQKQYLVNGDAVTVAGGNAEWTCALFHAGKANSYTVGWLAKGNLTDEKVRTYTADDFVGEWRGITSELTLAKADGGHISVKGSSSWHGANPGQVNTGEVDAAGAPSGNALKISKDGCEMDLHRVGDLLFVSDNKGCGGLNVSFDGLYVRAAVKKK